MSLSIAADLSPVLFSAFLIKTDFSEYQDMKHGADFEEVLNNKPLAEGWNCSESLDS